MMDQNIEEKKTVGLLPMGLAETNANERSGLKCYPIFQKVLAVLFLTMSIVVFYLLILRLLETNAAQHNTDIIVISGLHEAENMTILKDNTEVFLQVKNISDLHLDKRKKREAISLNKHFNTQKTNHVKFKDNQIQKAKKLIAEHDVLCNEENHKDICRELVMKIKSLTENNFSNQHENNEGIRDHKNVMLDVEKNKKHILEINPTDVSKRDIHIHSSVRPTKSVVSLNNEHDINYGMSEQYNIPHHSIAYPRDNTNPPLTDTCLLARLMRQSYPNFQGEYDTPNQGYPNIPLYSSQFPSGFPTSYLQTREVETHKHRLHPQDIEIAMNFIAPKLEASSKEASTNSSINEIECPIGSISCDNGNKCVNEKDWCDGNVDCDDVSDESRCSCKSRVDESRICDGYFDCPFGEDEMGCYGCSEGTFSCENVNMNSQSTCYSKEQRCNNVPNCPNHKDEIDCSMLAPSLHKKPLFSISNTEGYLYRNFKGNWYAVCSNPYMWAHDACRRETGLIIRPPFIQVLQIDPLIKVNYISTAPGGLIHTSNTCMNSSAVYVTCPDLLCGTRVLTAAQLLRENAAIENHLFGRNKRFLQRPYPVTFYDRTKRYVTNKDIRSEILLNYLDDIRKKRAESRVVGGRPSQPAAWPWMVALYRDGMFHCGGVIINQNWIMSAAHCVHKFWQHYYEVQVGMLRRFSFSPQEQNHRVSHVIVNQNYDQEDMKNDLSLLRVKPAIQFSRWVRPICLPSPEVAGSDWMWGPKPGTICTAVGWGATVEKGPDPDHMREVEIPVWESCKHEEDQAGKEICAGLVEGGKDACQGDSGGPLLCRNPVNAQQWYVAGIVSHGDGCARKGEPGVYTRISLFVQWIRYHTSTKTLPLIQPKQECPGFRCDSGISKCLPKKRMCDKIIDCLDGEDEFNCDSEKLPEESETNLILNPLTQESNISADRKSKSSDDINLMPNKNKTSIEKSDENIIDINNNHEISKNDLKFDENINSTQTATIPSLSTDSNLSENIEGTSSMKNIVLDDSIKDIKNPIINENKSFKVLENNTTPNYNKNAENNNIISSNSESNEDTSTVKNRKDNIQESSTSSIIDVTKNNTNKHPLPLEVTTEFHTNNDFALNDTINTTTTTIASIITTSKKELLNIDGELENIINLHDMGLEERDINLVKPIIDLDMLGDDIKHASTIEISNANSQENVNAEDLDGNITVDPLAEEFESFMKTEKPKSEPESDSFVLKRDPNSEKSNTTIKEIDIATTKTLSSTPLPSTAIKQEDELITKAPENNIDQKHNPLAIEELNLNTVTIDDTVNNDINIKDNVNQEIIKFEPANTTILEDQVISETQIDRKVNFQQLLDTNDSLNKIESIIMPSELEPAKKRKKHLTFSDFQCKRIFQIVPFMVRCDRKADCEDGTDELGCNCLDYLTTFDNKLICDGNVDCADGQDETDCYSCEEDHFLCKGSEVCLASKYVCDGKPQCPLGEDEIDCFTLSNGNHIVYDLNGRPEVTLEGYLTERHDKNWHIVCEEDMSIHQQEESASHICRYLGFSSANRYLIKHINVKENLNIIEDNRGKRDIDLKVPVRFAFKSNNNNELQTIEDPKIIKEECVPNITKTCMALYIYCDHSLFTNFNINHLRNNKEVKDVSNHWPWIAKLYMDGKYKCTGVLIDLSWVLISHLCLQGVTLGYDFITVLLGSHKTLDSAVGPYEQAYQVDAKKDLYRSKVMLLHLKQPAVYSAMVKPMVVTSSHFEDNKNKKCVAIGQDKHNKTFSVFLKETDDCDLHHRCFIRHENSSTCHTSEDNWAGIISCHSKQGWYPAASFVQIDDVCAFSEKILATDIGNIKHEIKYYEERPLSDSAQEKFFDRCDGVRCQRGSCIKLRSVCDGVTDCEDGIDESKESCKKKYDICSRDPHYRGCDCLVGQLKCHNGLCIPKELFKDGNDDCGDGTDEPKQTMCSDYLRRVMPSRLCDGILHCHDKSDEDPMFCKCFAKEAYKCSGMSRNEDYCVAMDMVCDGVPDCPGGEDEKTCIGLYAPQGTPHGNGEVIIRSHGVWYSKCYPTKNHTKSELESICRALGFISGHAKQLSSLKVTHPHNNVVIDTFSDVTLNNSTIIKLRNSHAPIARAIADEKENCYPVFIECL